MGFIEANYTKRKSIQHGFLDGLAPWMTENNTGGGTVTTEATQGGRAVLSAGTTAAGDRARIDLPPVTPAPGRGLDAVGFRVVFALNDAAAVRGDASIHFGYLDANVPGRLYHVINALGGVPINTPGMLRASNANGDNAVAVRDQLPTNAIESELLWDTEVGTVFHRYEDTFSGRADADATTVPNPTVEYVPKIQIGTNNTAADQILYLYEVELAYYARNVQ